MHEFDNFQSLMDLGCGLHKEGRETANEKLLLAGAASCMMAIRFQQSAVSRTTEIEPQEFPRNGKFNVVVLSWVLATVSYLITDAAVVSTLMWGLIAVGFVWQFSSQQAADQREAIHSAEQKLRSMEMQWDEEEDLADEFWSQLSEDHVRS